MKEALEKMLQWKGKKCILWGMLFVFLFSGCSLAENRERLEKNSKKIKKIQKEIQKEIEKIKEEGSSKDTDPEKNDPEAVDPETPYKILNNDQPEFTNRQKRTNKVFEKYSDLDSLGRCGVAFANICKKLMPKTKRGKIGFIKPTGWQTVKYNIVDGKYLYNRCHLIGFQLAGENANKKNLITGTRYLNAEGMLPFENQVADYVRKTGNHVLYRVTPVFEGDNLLASGVQMEAYSVEDKGKGICFNVYVYNIQPGVEINYANGKSRLIKKRK